MKYYETNFEEYINAVDKVNIHPELKPLYNKGTKTVRDFDNMIVFGASGVGKYSQVLKFIQPYSPTELKHTKRITIQTEKQVYTYHMSDIHYEIDISFLGCNSKLLWHELFFQIVDIVCTRPEKTGIIVCKNFHMIHSELLEIFYRYIQQYNNVYMNIQIKFILITEHISFIPTNILEICQIIPISRPTRENYMKMIDNYMDAKTIEHKESNQKYIQMLKQIDTNDILNLKEIHSFLLVKSPENLPTDIFNIVCDNIINDIESSEFDFIRLRDFLYDILIYNLDLSDCLWYIFTYFIEKELIEKTDVSEILEKTYSFLKYYNNNYRPIYHLENIFFFIIMKIKKYDEQNKCIETIRNRGKRTGNYRLNKKTVSSIGSEISSG